MPRTAESQWRVVAASVCGVSHQRQCLGCQDSHVWEERHPGLLVAAIADGAGSATHGHLGAEVASSAAVAALASDRGSSISPEACATRLKDALRCARDAVLERAVVEDLPARELATTLIVVIATRQLAAAAQIGDGAAVIRSGAGEVFALTRPPADEYINQTTFVVSDQALETAQFGTWTGKVEQVAALTDGLQRLALRMPSGEPHVPFFTPLFQFMKELRDPELGRRQLDEFLRSPRICDRADDDLTLLLAALTGP